MKRWSRGDAAPATVETAMLAATQPGFGVGGLSGGRRPRGCVVDTPRTMARLHGFARAIPHGYGAGVVVLGGSGTLRRLCTEQRRWRSDPGSGGSIRAAALRSTSHSPWPS